MLRVSENIQEKLNDMALFETEININRQVLHAVLAFIVSTLLFLIDSITNFSFTYQDTFLTLRLFAFIGFLYATYRTIELLLTWTRITSNN